MVELMVMVMGCMGSCRRFGDLARGVLYISEER